MSSSHSEKQIVKMAKILMDPIDRAKNRDADYFKQIDLDVLQNARDKNGASVLSVAVQSNDLPCCREIYKRCPLLLYQKNNSGQNALHLYLLSQRGTKSIFFFLLNADMELQKVEDIESREREGLLTMVDNNGHTALHVTMLNNLEQEAYSMITFVHNNKPLRVVDNQGNTAMHLAVKMGSFYIFQSFVKLDPDFEYCANESGNTLLWIAYHEALSGSDGKVRIRKFLMKKQPSQCKVRYGNKDRTLLHYGAEKGDVDGIKDIIQLCPDCIELLDNDGRNFLHVAAHYERLKVVRHILKTKSVPISILNGQDNEGNTPLHIAALGRNRNLVLSLLYDSRVIKTTLNKQGQKALDMINMEYDKRKAGVFGLTNRVYEKEIKDQRNFDLLVSALIAAVSFSAGFTVPGGNISDGPNEGTAILSTRLSFKTFTISNTIALMLSLYAVFCHFCTKRLHNTEDIIYQLNVATRCSLGAIFAMVVAFIAGSYAVLPVVDGFAITVLILCCCFFVFSFQTMWVMLVQAKPSDT